MVSIDDFWVYIYEKDRVFNLIKIKDKKVFSSDKIKEKFDLLIDKIENIKYNSINKVLNKLGKFMVPGNRGTVEKRKLLLEKYKEISKKYIEIGEENIVTDDGYHLIVFTSESIPSLVSSRQTYFFLRNISVKRGKKEWKLDDEIILDIFKKNEWLYRSTLYINKQAGMYQIMRDTTDILQNYFDTTYPIKFKHGKVKKQDVECAESKNGILRGIVHQIGFVGGGGVDLLSKIFKDGYLEIQNKEEDYETGIFTRVLGYQSHSLFKKLGENGIYIILSLAVLEDFDYWISVTDSSGARTDNSFYKGFCHGCEGKLKPLNDFSAAERGYIFSRMQKFHKDHHELVLNSDIYLERYAEAIIVPDKQILEEILSRKDIKPWVKALLVEKENKSTIYRKNCKGEPPKRFPQDVFKKIGNLLKKREKITDIPPLNINSINKKKKIELIYRDDVSLWKYTVPFPLQKVSE